jgi:hypothetical protein
LDEFSKVVAIPNDSEVQKVTIGSVSKGNWRFYLLGTYSYFNRKLITFILFRRRYPMSNDFWN